MGGRSGRYVRVPLRQRIRAHLYGAKNRWKFFTKPAIIKIITGRTR